MHKRIVRAGVMALPASLLLATPPVFAGELLPYQPPTAAQTEARVSKQAVAVKEDVFLEFKKNVETLTPKQREQLKGNLEQSRVASKRQGDRSREAYYGRLIDIMRKSEL